MAEGALSHAHREAGGSTDLDSESLEPVLRRICEQAPAPAREQPEQFVAYLAGRSGCDLVALSDDPPSIAELALCWRMRRGEASALSEFEDEYLTPLSRSLGKLRLSASELDELRQRVRTKLLVPDAAGGFGLEKYAGQGRLRGLVQVIATRDAVSVTRAARRHAPERELADAAVFDPGLELLKGRARAAFAEAFAEAVRALDARQRNLLRLHLFGGVTLEKLAAMYGVHRATIVRWLASAREAVLHGTRERLGARLELDGSELDSVMDTIQSRLDLSVERLFASHANSD